MTYKIVNCEQGSKEWFEARRGVITASLAPEILRVVGGLDERQRRFVELMNTFKWDAKNAAISAGYKAPPTADVVKRALAGEKVGDFSEAAKAEAFRIAAERVGGELLDFDGFENWQMKRGKDLEPAARAEHGMRLGYRVAPAGFVVTEDGKFGASADGLLGDHGGAEYKCFVSPPKLRQMILYDDVSEFLPQVHVGLWITGRVFWDFCLYCPSLASVEREFIRWRVYRDDDFIEVELVPRLLEFDKLVEGYAHAIKRSSIDRFIGKRRVLDKAKPTRAWAGKMK